MMGSRTEDLNLQKLEELVHDEDKIVTIPYLAKTLSISVQDSRNLISKYVKDQRKLKPEELAITYVLTGILQDQRRGVVFVKEDDLKEKRSLFDKIDSEVLFSVQKCKQIDFNVISLVDNITKSCDTLLLGSVVSKNCVKRILRVKKLPTPPPPTVKGKSSFFLPKTESSSSMEKAESTVSKQEKPSQNGIASMFGKATASQATKGKETLQKKSSNASNKSNKGGLSAFLSKGSSTSSARSEKGIKKENSTVSNDSQSIFEELMEVEFSEDMEEKVRVENEPEVKEKAKEEVKETDKNEVPQKKEVKSEKKMKKEAKEKKSKSKRQREKSEEKSVKKRKRIIQRIDSESDDLFGSSDEDVIEKSEEELPPSPKKPLAPKNKIRKAVDKTYEDEEGFIVTKTEYIYESAPEEEEVPVKKEEPTKPKLEKKTSASSENDISPAKGAKGKKGKKNNLQNQPTLMNFFKKK